MTISACNVVGIMYLADKPDQKVRRIMAYPEGDAVQVWIQTLTEEVLVYLNPEEAMAFGNALERCAVQALREKAG